jgi:hypothetical protein
VVRNGAGGEKGVGDERDVRVGCGFPDGAAFMWDVCCLVDSRANKRRRGGVKAQKMRFDTARINAD